MGKSGPRKVYARRMSAWLEILEPSASEAAQARRPLPAYPPLEHPARRLPHGQRGLSSVARHLWPNSTPRPRENSQGGYEDETIARVQSLVRKEGSSSIPRPSCWRTWRAWCSWKITSPSSRNTTTRRSSSVSCARPGGRCLSAATRPLLPEARAGNPGAGQGAAGGQAGRLIRIRGASKPTPHAPAPGARHDRVSAPAPRPLATTLARSPTPRRYCAASAHGRCGGWGCPGAAR